MSERLDQHSKVKEMSSSTEIPDLMWQAFPPNRHGNRKSWLTGVARALGWNQRRVKALFYCEARVVIADEWRTLNQRLDALKAAERRHGELIDELRTVGGMARGNTAMGGRAADSMGGSLAPASGAESRPLDPPRGRSVR